MYSDSPLRFIGLGSWKHFIAEENVVVRGRRKLGLVSFSGEPTIYKSPFIKSARPLIESAASALVYDTNVQAPECQSL